jgi:hypothetical protein
MKARSVSLTLYHFTPGHHREVCVWHDQDHKPEVVATMPHIFISQRWVAPPELMAARGAGTLPHNGGEYVNLYWSSGSGDEMQADFAVLGRRLQLVGRMAEMQYIERTWGDRLRPVSVQARAGLPLSPEAVTCAVQMMGLYVEVIELLDQPGRTAYARWHETEYIPALLERSHFSGAAKLQPQRSTDEMVTLFYSDDPDPLRAYQSIAQAAAALPAPAAAARLVHSGMYRPSIGLYDYYD